MDTCHAMYVLEICANGIENALTAEKHGAHRVELCENLESGGLTPSYGTLTLAAECIRIPVHVLIRPRRGNYVYSKNEKTTICREIKLIKELQFEGIVVGALKANGELDEAAMENFLELAQGLSVTFHRAIDVCTKPEHAIEKLIRLGVKRLLTSGGAPTAEQGISNITHWQKSFGHEITIMAGSGVNADNAISILAQSGISELHMSAKIKVRSHLHRYLTGSGHYTDDWWHHGADAAQIAKVRKLLDELAQNTIH
jgi:copper homeostasis protein